MELVLITGMSGAGKTKALNALEDIGYYCVDNIPPGILPVLTGLHREFRESDQPGVAGIRRLAVVVDARSREMFRDLGRILEEMKRGGRPYRIFFLDAGDDVLLKRYKETRRRHPLMDDEISTLEKAIETERQLMAPMRQMADSAVDTSLLLPAQLRERVLAFASDAGEQSMSITIMSFGFRNGLPPEADLVFDVRCLPNPFYVPQLRERTGDEPPVRDYVMSFPQSRQLLEKLEELLALSVPLYIREGKSQLTIAVGCTGGRHRSVAAAERLSAFLENIGYRASISHRDKNRKTQ